MTHNLDLGQGFDGRHQVLGRRREAGRPGPGRLYYHLQCAHPQGVKRILDLAGTRGPGDDHDRRRHRDHDLLGRLQAIQPGHVQVHGDQVGSELLRQRDGLEAVACLADDLDRGVGDQDRRQQGAGRRRIVGNEDADHGSPVL